MSDSLWPYGLQHIRPPCPSPSPEVCPNSYPMYQRCHPAISSSAIKYTHDKYTFSGLWHIYIYTHIYIILITRGDVFLSLNVSFICLLIWIKNFLNFWKWWYLLFIFLKKSIPMLYSSLLFLSLNYYNSAEHLKVSCWLQNPLPHKISCVFLNKDILLHDCSKWLKSGNLILIQNNDIIFSPY